MALSILELLVGLLAGAALGWLVGLRFGRVSEIARVSVATEEARATAARAVAAESSAKTAEAELKRLREQMTSSQVENARLQAEASRVPGLEGTLSELRDALSTAQKARAAAEARVEQIPALEASLKLVQQQAAEATETKASLQAKADLIPGLEAAVAKERARVDELQAALGRADQENARLVVQLNETGTRAQEQLAVLERAQTAFREAFQALSAEALKSNNQAFLDLAKTAMNEFQQGAKNELETREKAFAHLVGPVRESLANFDTAVQGLERNRLEAYTALSTQVLALEKGQKELHSETGKLVKALRAPNPRGRWGEIQLRRVVEMAGMVEHCDFDEQANVPAEEGPFRPDVVVHLPGTKSTVIDSKVPLTAYLDSLEAEDEGGRRKLLRDHAAQVRKHISQLASKAYWDQLPSSPDFVIMHVPLESAFAAALEEDPNLIDYAVGASVIPAGPMTLLTHLKAAAYGWRQERIAANAEHISELGKELYNRLSILASHFGDLGKHLGKATEAYNSAVGSLEHRVLIQARRFKDLGAATGEDLSQPEIVAMTLREVQAPELVAEQPGPPSADDPRDS